MTITYYTGSDVYKRTLNNYKQEYDDNSSLWRDLKNGRFEIRDSGLRIVDGHGYELTENVHYSIDSNIPNNLANGPYDSSWFLGSILTLYSGSSYEDPSIGLDTFINSKSPYYCNTYCYGDSYTLDSNTSRLIIQTDGQRFDSIISNYGGAIVLNTMPIAGATIGNIWLQCASGDSFVDEHFILFPEDAYNSNGGKSCLLRIKAWIEEESHEETDYLWGIRISYSYPNQV